MTDIAREKYINPYTDFGFEKLFKQAEIAKYDDIERLQYEASLKEYWDYYSTVKTAVDNKAKEIAREMKADGVPIATIAKYTGLSTEEIERL